jgi:hypothetical protein
VLKDLLNNRFGAIVPTHIYSSEDWEGNNRSNDRSTVIGRIRFFHEFRFPLHPVDDAGTKGLFLVVDDVWPDAPELWFNFCEDSHHVFFKNVAMIRVPEDNKVLVTLITVDQSHKDVELSPCLFMRVLTKPKEDFLE